MNAAIDPDEILGEVRTTDDLIGVWRTRKAAIGLSDLYLEELSGTHAARVLAGIKGVSQLGFGCISSTLALKYLVVQDIEQAEFMRERWQRRVETHVRDRAVKAPLPKCEITRLTRMAAALRANASHIERLVHERLVA